MTNFERRRAMARMKRINEANTSEINVNISDVFTKYIVVCKYIGNNPYMNEITYLSRPENAVYELDSELELAHLYFEKEDAEYDIKHELPNHYEGFENGDYLFEIHEVKITFKDKGNVKSLIM